MARTRLVRRWRRNMEVQDDVAYVDLLNTLSEGSVRRSFNPYTDIDWEAPEFAVTDGLAQAVVVVMRQGFEHGVAAGEGDWHAKRGCGFHG